MLAIVSASMPAFGDPVFIDNPSFENLPAGGLTELCGASCSYAVDFIPGWQNIPFAGLGLVSGQWQPGTHAGNNTYFDSLSDGITHAYTNGLAIAQPNVTTVEVGTVYTLRVDVGHRKDGAPTGSPRMRIATDASGLFIDGTGTPVLGGWTTYTAVYVGRPEHAGLAIDIVLGAGGVQGNFDAVRLDAPEPSGGLAFGMSGLLLLARQRGRRRGRTGAADGSTRVGAPSSIFLPSRRMPEPDQLR